jgi:adenine/guanine/hypoxanthine permease
VLERRFGFARNGTTLARDTLAGATTFVVMSYIIFVNPTILSLAGIKGLEDKGLPFAGVLTVTCLVAGVMTVVMGLYTNRAYALAPGLGINAIVAFTLVGRLGLSFPAAMGLIVLEGCLVTLLVLTGLREAIMRAIPLELKKAIAIGIGLFIAFIGLFNAGVVVKPPVEPVALAHVRTWPVFVTLLGLAITIALRARGFRGDLLVGIIATTLIATFVNWANDYDVFSTGARWPHDVVQHPDFSLLGNFDFDAFSRIGGSTGAAAAISASIWVFTLFLSDFFDTMGTLIGVGKTAGYLDREGNLPELRKPLLVDSVAAAAGGAASSSSATTYIESGAGVAAGGRTGWTAVVAGLLFFPFMFFAPLIGMVPPQATGPALVIVGWLMISSLTELEEDAEAAEGRGGGGRRLAGIDFHDLALGLPAALVILVMPFTFNISNGIGFGFVAYVLIRLAQGDWRRIHPFMFAAAAAFVAYFVAGHY